jgi:hypothetical protein
MRYATRFRTGSPVPRDGMMMAEHYKRVSRLTDGELAQRGLTRADIPRVVARNLLRA